MRILYIIGSLKGGGGAEKAPASIACRLATRYGHTIHVATIDQSAEHDQRKLLKQQDAKYSRAEMPLAKDFDAVGITYGPMGRPPGIKGIDLLVRYRYLRGLIKSFKPDLIHSHAYQPDFYNVTQWNGIAKLRTLHSSVSTTSHLRALLTEKLIDRGFETTIILCASLSAAWSSTFGKSTNWKQDVIPNPVSDVFFEAGQVRSSAPRPPYQLGIVGRLEEEKGHTYAIEALEALAEELPIELHLAGGGSLYPKLRAIADRLAHLKVHFLGSLSEEELVQLYRKLDLLLIPSLYEGFNLTAYESLAMGLPIVGTDVCGVRDILKACDREPIPIQDGPALRVAVKELLLDEQEYLRYAATAPKVVTHCRLDRVAEAHHQLYERLCL